MRLMKRLNPQHVRAQFRAARGSGVTSGASGAPIAPPPQPPIAPNSPEDRARENRRTGKRPEARGQLSVGAIVAVATHEVADDLDRLLVTAQYHMPNIPLHLACDAEAAKHARALANTYGLDNVAVHEWLTPDGLAFAESRVQRVTSHNDYWKPAPIWWKLEALRNIVRLYNGNRGVLLVDSDIVFARPVAEAFTNVDTVLSPFFWPDPTLRVARSPHDATPVPIAERDGWHNAGYLLTRSSAVCEAWLDLYERGVGGFYEQWILGYLPGLTATDVFGTAHNWGQWRREIPREDVVSLHIHARTKHREPFALAVQQAAEQATCAATTKLATWAK